MINFSFYRYYGWHSALCEIQIDERRYYGRSRRTMHRMVNSNFELVRVTDLTQENTNDGFQWPDKKCVGMIIGELGSTPIVDCRKLRDEYLMIIAFIHHQLQSAFNIDNQMVVTFSNGSRFHFEAGEVKTSLVLQDKNTVIYDAETWAPTVREESKRTFSIEDPQLFDQLYHYTQWVKQLTPICQSTLEPPPFLAAVLQNYLNQGTQHHPQDHLDLSNVGH